MFGSASTETFCPFNSNSIIKSFPFEVCLDTNRPQKWDLLESPSIYFVCKNAAENILTLSENLHSIGQNAMCAVQAGRMEN